MKKEDEEPSNSDAKQRVRRKIKDPLEFDGLLPRYCEWKGKIKVKLKNDYHDDFQGAVDYVKTIVTSTAYDMVEVHIEAGLWQSLEDI